MPTICFFNTAKAWGGGEKWHFEVSSYLYSKGYSVIVIAHRDSVLLQKLKSNNIPNDDVSITNLSFLNPLSRKKVKNLLIKHSVETIVLNLSSDVKIAGTVARSIGIKRIIYRRGSAIPIKNTLLNRYLFSTTLTEVLANSQATKNTVLRNNPNLFDSKKIKVIYNGVRIINNSDVDNIYNNIEKFTLINLGRLEHQKNQLFLIDVAKRLAKKGLDFKLIIGGQGRLKTKLEEKIRKEGLKNVVELYGFVEKPIDFIAQGHIFLLPSLWEGFGYVLAEASLCKKPCIAFNLSSNPEIVMHDVSGILTKPNDLEEFTSAIEYFYNNREKLEEMGSAGRKFISDNFEESIKWKEVEEYLMNEG